MAWMADQFGSALVLAATLAIASCGGSKPAASLFQEKARSADPVPLYGVLEISFTHDGHYENNFLDVVLDAVFTPPTGAPRRVPGFYYAKDLWKLRFRPHEPGQWTYTWLVSAKGGFERRGSGAFYCSASHGPGPVRRNPQNPYRWVSADGQAFFPLGLQDCVSTRDGRLGEPHIDGEGRDGPARAVSWEEYFATYGRSGFNLFRFSQKNCSFLLMDDLDHYRVRESMLTDQLLSLARNHGFRVMFGFFGYHGSWGHGNRYLRVIKRSWARIFGPPQEAINTPDDQETIAKEQRFIRYCVARWGVYADFWELLNERYASDRWAALMADFVRSVDPERKPVSISWEKPNLPAIDVHAPHWYESEGELQSDLRVRQMAAKWKKPGKPVIVGEQGNSGMNWDPFSARRMRIRIWTALFQEIDFIFWNTSWSKAGMHNGRYTPGAASNIYLGPEERSFARVRQQFASRLGPGVRMAAVETSASSIRAYALVSDRVFAAYLHDGENRAQAVMGETIQLDIPTPRRLTGRLSGEWIDPSRGDTLARVALRPGRQKIDVPPFIVDLALLVSTAAE